ncbi:MAG: DUF1592 domain-containing protein [Polyangiaceae bacterium]
MHRTSELLKWVVPLLCAVGCSSGGVSGAPKSDANPGGSGAGAGAGSGGSGSSPGTTTQACPTQALPRTSLRRLTRFEYGNTLRDLLGADPSVANDLPADEVTNSFDNNAAVLTVSSLHAEKYVLISEAVAKSAVQTNLAALTACDSAAKGEDACALQFARSFGRRAFRRPTTAEDERILLAAYAAGRTGGSYAEGIEVMIRAALQSADFLYRLELPVATETAGTLVPLSQFELATRLSYLVWGSSPDDALLDVAARGELANKDQLAAKARDMLKQPKARAAATNFVSQWTGVKRLDVTSKSATLFPLFTDGMRDAMARELPAFLDYVLWTGDRSLKTLLTSPVAFVSGPLAQVYSVASPASSGTDPVRVDLPDTQGRAGILTQAGFLSAQAHPDQTSPVLRGKFVRTMLLCQDVPPPPPDVNISLPTIDQGATARDRFSAHLTAGASCNGCHHLMDPIGLSFENFDAMGQYRTTDNGRPIDVSGQVQGATDASLSGDFKGVRELADKLAASQQVRDCVATQWFRFASGRNESDGDACSLATLRNTFSSSDGDIVELMVGMTQTDAFWYRTAVTP